MLRAFLSLIVEGNVIHQPVDSWAEWTDPIPVSRLVAFLLKYSCDVDLKMLNNCIKMHATTSPLVAFTVAALQDDSAWCSQLLKIPSWPRDTESPTFSAFGGAPNSSNLDPRGAPLSYWDLFPRHYLWALSRAWTYAPKEQDRFTRSVAFLNFLLAAKEGRYSLQRATLKHLRGKRWSQTTPRGRSHGKYAFKTQQPSAD